MSKSRICRSALMLVVAVVVTASVARGVTWDGGGDGQDWFDGDNWDPNGVPTAATDINTNALGSSGTPVVINNASAAVANSIAYNSVSTANAADAYLDIATDLTVTDNIQLANLGTGQVNHTGGTVASGTDVVVQTRDDSSFWKMSAGATLNVGNDLIVTFNDAYMEQVAGSTVTVAGDMVVRSRADSKSGVSYEMTGGVLTINNTASSAVTQPDGLGVAWGGTYGIMVESGGTVTVNNGGNLEVAARGHSSGQSGNGEFVITGTGALTVDGTVVLGSTNSASTTSPPTAGVGLFTVIGGGAGGITVGGWDQRAETQEGRGDLKCLIDDSVAGIKTINVLDSALFGGGSQLIVGFADGVTPYAGTWTLMSLTNGVITDDGLVFADGVDQSTGAGEEGWTMDVGTSALMVTYVTQPAIPEPATLLMLALGLGGLAGKLRRRRA